MELIFKKEKSIWKKDKYFVSSQGEIVFEAYYDSKTQAKEVYDSSGNLLAQGYYWWEKQEKIFKNPPYILRLLTLPEKRLVVYSSEHPDKITWFENNGDRYSSYYHLGCVVSIFKNDIQIASYNTENDSSNNWNMILTADDDIEQILLVIYALHIYSDFLPEGDGRVPSLNLAFWSKKPNLEWQPKRVQ